MRRDGQDHEKLLGGRAHSIPSTMLLYVPCYARLFSLAVRVALRHCRMADATFVSFLVREFVQRIPRALSKLPIFAVYASFLSRELSQRIFRALSKLPIFAASPQNQYIHSSAAWTTTGRFECRDCCLNSLGRCLHSRFSNIGHAPLGSFCLELDDRASDT